MKENNYPKDVFGRYWPLEDALNCVGPGWKNIVTQLWNLCKNRKINIHQIKEKFGGLRFYVVSADDETYNIISEFEQQSYSICELCGESGEIRTSLRWHKTLCRKHYELAVNDYDEYMKSIRSIGEKHTAKSTHVFSPEGLASIRKELTQ